MRKPRKKKLKLNPTIPAFRERQDIDYFDKLPETAQRYLMKFLDELYGRKFNPEMLGKTKQNRKTIYHETYAANNDCYVLVRVDVDPASVDLKIQTLPSLEAQPATKLRPEVDRIYVENGQRIVRYKTVKK